MNNNMFFFGFSLLDLNVDSYTIQQLVNIRKNEDVEEE